MIVASRRKTYMVEKPAVEIFVTDIGQIYGGRFATIFAFSRSLFAIYLLTIGCWPSLILVLLVRQVYGNEVRGRELTYRYWTYVWRWFLNILVFSLSLFVRYMMTMGNWLFLYNIQLVRTCRTSVLMSFIIPCPLDGSRLGARCGLVLP